MSWYSPKWFVRITHIASGIFVELDEHNHRNQHLARDKGLRLLNAKINHPCGELHEVAVYDLPDDQPCPHDLSDYRKPTPPSQP